MADRSFRQLFKELFTGGWPEGKDTSEEPRASPHAAQFAEPMNQLASRVARLRAVSARSMSIGLSLVVLGILAIFLSWVFGPAAAQRGFVEFEAIERCVDRAIAQGGEAGNTEVEANGSALRLRGFHFTAGLDRDMPFARAQAGQVRFIPKRLEDTAD